MLDEIDLTILKTLQANARTPNAGIARQVGMAPSAIHERIRKLEEQGVIQGYEARINPQMVGLNLTAFVYVNTNEPVGGVATEERLVAMPEVQEVHHIAGEDCYLLKVRTADTETLGCLLRERFGAIEWLQSTRTTIVLGTMKDTSRLPIQ